MNAKDIQKKIQRYTRGKIILSILIVFLFLCLCIGLLSKNNYVAIVAYFMLFVVVIIGYLYPVNQPLLKKPMVQDYKGILEYLANTSGYIGKHVYYDGLIMIKKSLDEIAHYKLNGEEEYLRNNVFYLQGKFHSTDKKNFIPQELYDREYLSDICNELMKQLRNKVFTGVSLDAIKPNNKYKTREKHIFPAMIFPLMFCNCLLVILVIFKTVVSISSEWYNIINEVMLLRIIYNTGTDVIAVVLAIWSYLKRKEE